MIPENEDIPTMPIPVIPIITSDSPDEILISLR